ncbi:SPOR domain-containing protein [Pseudoteredinibacter isoporae]|uniref:SPOR domain-containing protein n=1 Tax=Pseudoteredinibacter isoporae TaxID=570281 RepID=UPI003106E645
MKAVFVCLFVLNAVLLAWALGKEEPRPIVAKAKLGEGVAEIALLSEHDLSEGDSEESPEEKTRIPVESVENIEVATEITEVPESDPVCTLLGPFDELLQAEYAVEHLASLEVEAAIETLEIPGDPGFWVYLSPLPSRKEALRKLHELQAKGIDSYVIPKGDIVNGISFGMYSRGSSAQTRQKEVAGYGYQADIKEVVRSYEETWVVVQPSEAEKMNNESWQNFMNKRKGIERRENYCPGVASL